MGNTPPCVRAATKAKLSCLRLFSATTIVNSLLPVALAAKFTQNLTRFSSNPHHNRSISNPTKKKVFTSLQNCPEKSTKKIKLRIRKDTKGLNDGGQKKSHQRKGSEFQPIAKSLNVVRYCLLFIAYCLLFIVYCLLFIVYCLYCLSIASHRSELGLGSGSVRVVRVNLTGWSGCLVVKLV